LRGGYRRLFASVPYRRQPHPSSLLPVERLLGFLRRARRCSPIGMQAVAAGDGRTRTWTECSPSTHQENRPPERAVLFQCLRPTSPPQRTRSSPPPNEPCKERTNAPFTSGSGRPHPSTSFAARRQNALAAEISASSLRVHIRSSGSLRGRGQTAAWLQPPRRPRPWVKRTPRKGKAGSGTGKSVLPAKAHFATKRHDLSP